MLVLEGRATGIDLPELLDCARRLGVLVGHELPGQVVKAGQRLDLHPVSASVEQARARAAAGTSAPAAA
jgi:hydroxymethylglutaryl-CoA lyase